MFWLKIRQLSVRLELLFQYIKLIRAGDVPEYKANVKEYKANV